MQDRRNFLKTLSFAMAGTSLLSSSPLQAATSKNTAALLRTGIGSKMRMTYFPYELQLNHVFTVATFSRKTTPTVQLQIDYDGVVGYGEASMPPYLGESIDSVMSFLQKVNLEQFSDPFLLEDILAYVDGIAPGNHAAKAAVDIALHDLLGKLMQTPWYKIWGLNKQNTPSTSFTIGIDTAEVVKEKTLEAADRFNLLKVKLGRDNDKEMIQTIRLVSNLPIAVDVNQGWTDKHFALDMINWLKEQGIVMVEQPMPKGQIDDMAWLTQHSPLPTFADESMQRLSDVSAMKGLFSGINIKLMKCTGMREAYKMMVLARALDMQVMIGCMTETSCAVSAAAQLSAGVDFADLDGNLLIGNDLYRGVEIVDGKITLNKEPGIGVIKL